MEGIPMLMQVPFAVLILSASLLLVAASVLLYRKSQTEEREAIRRREEDRQSDPLAVLDALNPDDENYGDPRGPNNLTVLPLEAMRRAGLTTDPNAHHFNNRPMPGEMPSYDDESEWEFTPSFVDQDLDPPDELEDEDDDTGYDADLEEASA